MKTEIQHESVEPTAITFVHSHVSKKFVAFSRSYITRTHLLGCCCDAPCPFYFFVRYQPKMAAMTARSSEDDNDKAIEQVNAQTVFSIFQPRMRTLHESKPFQKVTSQVIDCHAANLRTLGFASLEAWLCADPEKHIYIGRNMTVYVPGAIESKWANPYSVKQYGLHEALRLYELHVRKHSSLWNELPELDGRVLGCWCRNAKSPQNEQVCHGDILVRLLHDHHAAKVHKDTKSQ